MCTCCNLTRDTMLSATQMFRFGTNWKIWNLCLQACRYYSRQASNNVLDVANCTNFAKEHFLAHLVVINIYKDTLADCSKLQCPKLRVNNAYFGLADGDYECISEVTSWAPDRPVYQNIQIKDR